VRSPIAPFPLVLEPVGDDAGDDSHARGEDKTLGCVCLALAKVDGRRESPSPTLRGRAGH
jgi:hypothetical protein